MQIQKHLLDVKTENLLFMGFLYLLKEESTFNSLKLALKQQFDFASSDETKIFFSLNPHSPTYLRLKPLARASQSPVDVHLKPLEQSLVAQMLWFSPPEMNKQAAESLSLKLTFYNDWQQLIENLKQSIAILGQTALFLVHTKKERQELFAEFQLTNEMVMATKDGLLHFSPYPHKRRHLYILETSPEASWHDPLTTDFTVMDWHFHKLQREKSYFDDRLRTINKERITTDKQLSDILYSKNSNPASERERAEFLENQLTTLAQMYSLTANNLHLAREAVATVRGDVQAVISASQKLGEANLESFPRTYLFRFESWLAQLIQQENDLKISLKNIKAAIDIMDAQVELHRGNEALALQNQTKELLNQNIALQEEVFSLQSAAELVELVVVFYYTLKSWEGVAPEKLVADLPPLLKFFPVALFSVAVVAATHYLAESRYHRHPNTLTKLTLAVILVIIALLLMVFLPVVIK